MFGNWGAKVGRDRWRVYGYGCPYRLHRDPDTLVCFDASVCSVELAGAANRFSAFIDGVPALAVEVLDLGDTYEQMRELVDAALMAGVPLVWVIDPSVEVLAVYRPDSEPIDYSGVHEIAAKPYLPGFRCRVAEIFE